ncbi:hypothetical protein [Poseidonibacter lekithochrous]|uniref:hypothetical protein n=1 Tax=Poseidonibacter lekithochrous TaxID=1904463 RepID=UPI0008FC31D6|nr:hypothetical protein [Poseidonibacter lekithochrous]QKJ22864.1 hypothetical protein ALEK_1593 [Poseidonibacter lekithochrous]
MSIDQEIEQILDSLRKVAFYVGHGKYNDYMTTEEVNKIKATLESILEIEKEYENAKSDEEKEIIYKQLSVYKTYSVKDFIDYKL